ncbi:MAG: hypothetical protein ABJF88_00565 [Rhodothermales bacterium]
MLRIASLVLLLLIGCAPASAQSLYTSLPGVFAAAGTFGLQEGIERDRAFAAEAGYRIGNGLDLSLGVRHVASSVVQSDYGSESSAWELRPTAAYHRELGPHAVLQVRGLLSAGAYRSTFGGFSFGPTMVDATRFDADVSALLFGRLRLGNRLEVLPGAGLYHLRTLSDDVDVSTPYECEDVCVAGLVGYDVAVRSTGVEFALPVSLRLGEQHLVLSPTFRYALSDTYQILERVVDLSLRFNF